MTYAQWLAQAVSQLQQAQLVESAKLDAQLLLEQVTGKNRAYQLAFADSLLSEQQQAILTTLLARRLRGEPMAYILGEKEFWSLPLLVSPYTLIPRPDTECLVESAVDLAKVFLVNSLVKPQLRILDLGTGTGAIALALASELTPWAEHCGIALEIYAVDVVEQAVALAQQNAQRHNLNIKVIQSHWFDQLDPENKFDLIVSNPPYIDENDQHLQQGDVRFEPHSALVASQQGLGDLHWIVNQARYFLRPQGYLILEHGWQQGEKVRSFFSKDYWQQVETRQDYGQRDRITLGCLKA
ncbi:peptide chain release factor N(5)-glutamine methyltransferase [Volucribacter amazonae]|uniref:Release factor glutamine methyltransferase n=1 Tax=Volucribacter amazonae TaxID=256731 RepID=A0A9X4PAU4_9PAST|nr:peptide chain release factor N(5)-glutamine methyltransferase [Volucribacter amazonae]MDG6894264.1 protein-(glutamine-N5) methyltransferase, release factor-specific [Volucribacter amazonae]